MGLTGIDDAARALSRALANVNVKCDFVSVPTHPTITKLRVLSRNQQLIRLDFEEGFSGVDPQPMHERIQQALGSIGALVLSDYARGADQRPDHDPTRTRSGRAGADRSERHRFRTLSRRDVAHPEPLSLKRWWASAEMKRRSLSAA